VTPGFNAWKAARVSPHDAANDSQVLPAVAAKARLQVTVWRGFNATAKTACGKSPSKRRDLRSMVGVPEEVVRE
jgi:hypothetical protein